MQVTIGESKHNLERGGGKRIKFSFWHRSSMIDISINDCNPVSFCLSIRIADDECVVASKCSFKSAVDNRAKRSSSHSSRSVFLAGGRKTGHQETTGPLYNHQKTPNRVEVRAAVAEDASAIADVYAQHVLYGTASFEIKPPDAEEILRRRAAILELGLPYLIAEIDREVAGYAYVSRFRPRAAYRFTVENSVYVAERFQRRGVARLLMQCLIERCVNSGIREMIAVIANPSISTASVELHRSLGFNEVGVLHGVGEKFGKVIDVLMMQKSLTRP